MWAILPHGYVRFFYRYNNNFDGGLTHIVGIQPNGILADMSQAGSVHSQKDPFGHATEIGSHTSPVDQVMIQ